MLKASVVLPAFNASDTIETAIRSILDQTLSNIELVVVDDGSTDNTAAVVASIEDPRLRLMRCPHRGVAAAANEGTKLAHAEFIARMDADDFAHPQRLEKQLRLLLAKNLDVVGCQVRILDQSGGATETMQRYQRWINEDTIEPHQITALRFVELPLVNPTILARRAYFELGFRDNGLPEDYDLMLRAAAEGMRFGKVDEVLFNWIDSPQRITRTQSQYSAEAFDRCRRTHLLAGPLHEVGQVDLWGVGKTGKPWLRWLQSHGIAVRGGYDLDPRKQGKSIHGVAVAHPDDVPAADGTPLIVAVGAAGARDLILPQLTDRGYVSGHDAWSVA